EVAQADTALMQLGTQLVAEGLRPGAVSAPGNTDPYAAPSGVYPCAGDDEWCVVTVRADDEWAALCGVLERPGLLGDGRFATARERIANRAACDALVADWLRERDPQAATAALQAAGVPAGAMLRLPQLLTDPHLSERRTYTSVAHELLSTDLPGSARVAVFDEIPDPPARQAPLAGEQTRQICAELLGMDEAEIDVLVRAGVLQPAASDPDLVREAAPSSVR
uniref:CoA transferase n=1 Tax=Aldersonia kunmingensis TaxID=408066 RepID=UPI000A97FEC2